MRWSFKVARLAGIDVYIHLTFLILLVWIGFSYYGPRQSIDDAIQGVVFILAVFGTVVLHELGHSLAARRYGIETRDITLLPIGGVARLERMPEEPWQELVVAVAGPLVNVAIAAGLLVGIVYAGGFAPIPADAVERGDIHPVLAVPFIDRLFMVNVFLVAFNAIPAFPMDGGRVLRAVLAMFTDYASATQTAAIVGQGFAFLFVLAGLFGIPGVVPANPMLLFIALFVWIGAAGEASMAQLKAVIAGVPVRKAMIEDFTAVGPDATLRDVADHILRGFQTVYPVVDGGRVVGVVTQQELVAGIAAEGLSAPVAKFMRTDFQTADPGEMLDRALARLHEGDCPALPVVAADGTLVGLLTPDNVSELVTIRQAVKARRAAVAASTA